MGGDQIRSGKNRLYSRNAALVATPIRAGSGKRPGLTTSERERLKQLEKENRELKRANEILRLASAYFAKAELDRTQK